MGRGESAKIIDGAARAAALEAEVGAGVAALKAAGGPTPGLAAIVVGAPPASLLYVGRKAARARACGMAPTVCHLPTTTSESELLAAVAGFNTDPAVHAIIVQLPLPPHIRLDVVLESIAPEKDVDGFHPLNSGRLANRNPAFIPCTPAGCMLLLRETIGSLRGRDALIVGCSTIVGRPLAQLLLDAGASVAIAHEHSRDLPDKVSRAEILVSAAGVPGLIRGAWLRRGAVVLDVGINRVPAGDGRRVVGDVCFAEAIERAGAITPVPGGVGPMTVACLLANSLAAARRSLSRGRVENWLALERAA